MALVKWTASAGGDFSDAADWSGGAVPQSGDAAQIEVAGITVTVGSGSQTVSSLTTVGSALSIDGGTLTTLNDASIGGALSVSAGALELYGSGATFYEAVQQTGGLIALQVGQLISTGGFTEDGGTLALGYQGGTFSSLSLQAGTITSSAAVLDVGSVFVQSGGLLATKGRDDILSGTFTQMAGGTIDLLSGALELEGVGTLAGTITGNGTLLVAAGTTTLASGIDLGVPNVEVEGGRLVLGAAVTVAKNFSNYANSLVALDGQTLTLSGFASLEGEFGGPGTLLVAGGGEFDGLALDGSTVMNLTSSVNQTGDISLGNATGSRAQLDISSAGRIRIDGNLTITDVSGDGQLSNSGTIGKVGGSGLAIIDTNVVSKGVINAAIGTLAFGGPTGSFGGKITGAGTFALTGGQNQFLAGLALSVGTVLMNQSLGAEQLTLKNSLAYAGIWSQSAGTLWLDGAGVTLTDSGQVGLDGGLVTGNGTLDTTGHVNVSGVDIEGTATLVVSGTVNQTTSATIGAQIGAAPELMIESGATWKIENNASLGGLPGNAFNENAVITNDGLLEKLNGSANSDIAGTLDNELTGTLQVGNATLTLYGDGSLAGTLTGKGVLDLQGDYTLASGVAVSVGDLGIGNVGTVTLGGSLADAKIWSQSGGTLLLGGNTLTLSGQTSLEGGMLGGAGTMLADGATTLGDNFGVSVGTLEIGAGADQIGDIYVGDYQSLTGGYPAGGTQPASDATLQIDAGATYRLDDNVNIASNGTLAVAGTLSALGGGASSIGPSVIDTGSILAGSANLRFLGAVSGSGSLVIGAGGSVDFAGTVASSITVSFATGTGAMLIEDQTGTDLFGGLVAGFQSGDVIEFANLSTNMSTDTLVLTGGGTIATITDTGGDSASLTFTTAQSSSSLSLGLGAHGELALFHA